VHHQCLGVNLVHSNHLGLLDHLRHPTKDRKEGSDLHLYLRHSHSNRGRMSSLRFLHSDIQQGCSLNSHRKVGHLQEVSSLVNNLLLQVSFLHRRKGQECNCLHRDKRLQQGKGHLKEGLYQVVEDRHLGREDRHLGREDRHLGREDHHLGQEDSEDQYQVLDSLVLRQDFHLNSSGDLHPCQDLQWGCHLVLEWEELDQEWGLPVVDLVESR